jgi:carnitine 3-dehydrogenase
MEAINPADVSRVAVIGTGVIGAGWTAHFLRNGLDVVAYDPAPKAASRLRRMVADVWPIMVKLGLGKNASPDRLTFAPSVSGAVGSGDSSVHFVQESAPENAEIKIKLLAEIDAVAPSSTVIASSTSGFAMTLLQKECQQPERTIVGHPFNPPYLIPLVEVVGGKKTDPAFVDWGVEFYASAGKRPLKLERELSGFIGNRLQEAMWREALHMVANGMATVEEIDAAIVDGPGLRWAIMGPCLTFHLAGGPGGMAHMLDHFGPALKEPWTWLEAPELTPGLREAMVDGCQREAAGRTITELEKERDACLLAIMEVLEKCRQA